MEKSIFDPSNKDLIAHVHNEIIKPNNKILTGVLAKFEFDVVDQNGNVLMRAEGPSHSFLRNFGRMFRQIFLATDSTNEQVTDTGGIARTMAVLDLNGVGGNESPIVPGSAGVFRFGSSSAAVLSDQFDVQTFITDAETTPVVTTRLIENTSQIQFKFDGAIQNTSGGTWNVTEMVLCSHLRDGVTTGQSRKVAMLRDIFSVVNVPNLSTANGHYTISVPV